MAQLNFLIYIPILLSMIISLKPSFAVSPPVYLDSICTYATLGPNPQTNLKKLFQELISNATNRYGYHNATVGVGKDDVVYGHFLCRGDQIGTSCQDCVTTATTDLPFNCNTEEAIIWYDQCMVRYSNQWFFGIWDQDLGTKVEFASDVTQYTDVVHDMLINITNKAALGGSDIKYGTGAVRSSSLEILYGLVQCTPDLSYNDCSECLGNAIALFPITISNGSSQFRSGCNVRYENYPFFYGATLLGTALPSPTAPPTTSNHTGPGPEIVNLDSTPNRKSRNNKTIVTVTTIAGTAILVAIVYFLCRRKARQAKRNNTLLDILEGNQSLDKFEKLPLFKFEKLSAATNNFQESNKLGQGGFGPVYKGTLEDGQEVAIKRLSGTSRQGAEEFMNEVLVISKLQHRNLVKLLGCCAECFERMLIYDYMPNKSLDAFLFDPQKNGILDWRKRYTIIEGISRGLLYLHRDSRLKIIHRDLKAANILLDENLTPKISDFGMARIFGGAQIEADTTRVVGTYGYMPPEYAIEGRFSEKSDVFSFGVLLLEIITGKKTRWFDESSLSLLGYVWKQWNEGDDISLIDPIIAYQGFETEISKCIHVGLLCVQEYAQDRPDISDVISKLSASNTVNFQMPKQPGFTRFMRDTSSSTQSQPRNCTNELSITNINGR